MRDNKQYAFPRELANLIHERWDSYVHRGDVKPPPIPDLGELSHLLETAFLASLEREEGRTLRFTLCCAPTMRVPREWDAGYVPLIPFKPQRPFDVSNLRSLAPAINRDTAALLVTYGSGPTSVAGILHLGSDLSRARSGKSFFYNPPPYALTIEVRGPGELHVYQGATKLSALRGGELLDQAVVSALDFTPIIDILKSGQDALWSRIVPPAHEPPREWAEFQFLALLNTILCVANGMKAHGHGGTLLLVKPDLLGLPLRSKYETEIDVNFLDEKFVGYINSRHRHADAVVQQEQADPGAPPSEGERCMVGSVFTSTYSFS